MTQPLKNEELTQLELQLRETQTSIAYDTKEYVVEVIVTRFSKGLFYIPEYQRKFVWDKNRQSKFIESLVLPSLRTLKLRLELDLKLYQ